VSRMQSARIVLLLTTLASAFTAIAADSESHPIAARVVPVRSQSNLDWRPVGNISVTFSDGHEEMWTTSGHCLRPRPHTLAWWAGLYGTAQHSRGGWINTQLRIPRTDALLRVLTFRVHLSIFGTLRTKILAWSYAASMHTARRGFKSIASTRVSWLRNPQPATMFPSGPSLTQFNQEPNQAMQRTAPCSDVQLSCS
jgi:hypothetical protein